MSSITEKLTLANENVPKVYAAGVAAGDGVDLSNYVRFTDVASEEKAGVVKVVPTSGIEMEEDGSICVKMATDEEIEQRTDTCHPIVPANLTKSVKTVLADIDDGIVIGNASTVSDEPTGIAIGLEVQARGYSSIAIGNNAASVDGGVQLGSGTNTEGGDSLQVGPFLLMNSDGYIPKSRKRRLVKSTNTSLTIKLDNSEYYSYYPTFLSELTIDPRGDGDRGYTLGDEVYVVFNSGETPTVINVLEYSGTEIDEANLYYSVIFGGSDCDGSGNFTPQAYRTYEVIFKFNGDTIYANVWNKTAAWAEKKDLETLENDLTAGKYLRTVKTSTDPETDTVCEANTEYYYSTAITKLTLSLPSFRNIDNIVGAEMYVCFASGETPTEIVTNVHSNFVWKWHGDDCADNVFTPQANTQYEISIKIVIGKLVARVAVV